MAAGALATMVGIGAALSNATGGILVQDFGYAASFLSLAGIATIAFAVLWFAVPETRLRSTTTSDCPEDGEFVIADDVLDTISH